MPGMRQMGEIREELLLLLGAEEALHNVGGLMGREHGPMI